jgi:hypothetical protein
LKLSFLRDTVAFYGCRFDEGTSWGGDSFCGYGGRDVELSYVWRGRIVILDAVEDCGERNTEVWWTA